MVGTGWYLGISQPFSWCYWVGKGRIRVCTNQYQPTMNLNQNNSKNQCFAAIFSLIADGQYPTIEKVRVKARCSKNTAQKWITQFKEEHPQSLEDVKNNFETVKDLTPEIHKTVTLLVHQLEQKLSANWIDDRLQESEKIIEDLEKQLEEANKVNYKLESRVDSLKETVEQLIVALKNSPKDKHISENPAVSEILERIMKEREKVN